MTIKNGTMKIYRNEALQIQLPPSRSIERFNTNVKAKKNAATIPNKIGRILTPHFKALFPILKDCSKIRKGDLMILRSEEHTSELQSRFDLVCRLLLEKKKLQTKKTQNAIIAHNQ